MGSMLECIAKVGTGGGRPATGDTPSFSRPRVSNGNPFSESLFRTLKYRLTAGRTCGGRMRVVEVVSRRR